MPSLSRYRIHKNLVPSRRNTTPSFSIGLAILHLLSEGRAECFEFRFEEPDVSTHYAEMGNLLSLNPKIHSLWAHAKIPRSFPNCEWAIIARYRRLCSNFDEGVLIHGTVLRSRVISLKTDLLKLSLSKLPKIRFIWVVIIGFQIAEHRRHRIETVVGNRHRLRVAQLCERLRIEAIIALLVVGL